MERWTILLRESKAFEASPSDGMTLARLRWIGRGCRGSRERGEKKLKEGGLTLKLPSTRLVGNAWAYQKMMVDLVDQIHRCRCQRRCLEGEIEEAGGE